VAHFADYYREIYLRGLGGETPAIPVAVEELERRAEETMEERAANYVFAGAGTERTMRANRAAFERWEIVPRMLRDVSERDLSTELLGTPMPAPLLLAPIGVQRVLHEEGELATARAAATLGLPLIASTNSHFTLEEIAAAGGEAPRWFQLYWPNDRELARSFVERAAAAGYGAIVLTVDTFIPGWKPRDLQQAWLPFLNGMGVANYFQDPVFRAGLEKPPEEDQGAARDRRHRRLQPRRPPGRRRGRLARHPAADRRGRRRGADDPLRQRHPRRRRRAQGARPRRRRRLPRPPLPLGLGSRRPGGRRNGAQDGPRRARPDPRPLRLHRPEPTRTGRAPPGLTQAGASIFGKSGGTRSTRWPPGRAPSSLSSRESSPSAASSRSLVRGR